MVVYAKAQLEQECLPSPICTDSDIDDEAAFDSTAEFPRLVIGFCGYFFFFFLGGGGGGVVFDFLHMYNNSRILGEDLVSKINSSPQWLRLLSVLRQCFCCC